MRDALVCVSVCVSHTPVSGHPVSSTSEHIATSLRTRKADYIAAMWSTVGSDGSAFPGRSEREAWVRAREQEVRNRTQR